MVFREGGGGGGIRFRNRKVVVVGGGGRDDNAIETVGKWITAESLGRKTTRKSDQTKLRSETLILEPELSTSFQHLHHKAREIM